MWSPQAAPATGQPAPALVNLSMRATPLELVEEVGLQTRVPIGIIPGQDANALCKSKSTFVFLGDDPRDALDAIAQQAHFTLSQADGVFLLTAPDVTAHQRDVLNHRFRIYRAGRKVHRANDQRAVERGALGCFNQAHYRQLWRLHISLGWRAKDFPAAGVAQRDSSGHCNAGGQIFARRRLISSRINPSRVNSSDDLKIQFESYGYLSQLKLDMRCP